MLKHGILGLLNYSSMSGYDIMLTFKNSLSFFWNAQTSQIYRELQTLGKNGWVTDTLVPQTGKPDKKVYTITKSGKAELNRWLADDCTELRIRSPLMMKTFFRGERSLDENIEYFKSLQDDSTGFLSLLQDSPPDISRYQKVIDDPAKAVYWKMTLEFGMMYAQMYQQWVEKCIKELEDIKQEHTSD